MREQNQRIEALARITGEVRLEPPGPGEIVVFLVRDDPSGPQLADHFTLDEAGRFGFVVTPGRYEIGAFDDLNRNLVYEPGEPYLPASDFGWKQLAAGARLDGVSLVIPRDATARRSDELDIAALKARNPVDQLNASISRFVVRGELASLDDPRFAREIARKGLWRPLDFVFDDGPGLYFLEPYDPKRVPVLFVHGILGSPREFATLAKALDPEHEQAWVFFYPSGAALDVVAGHLVETLRSLRRRLEFEDVVLVCHSMGGLPCRSSILAQQDAGGRPLVRSFVTIATPWGGHLSAANVGRLGDRAVRSWLDVSPGSPFLRGLFYSADGERRVLPRDIPFYLIFGYQRSSEIRSRPSDGVIPLESALRLEAQEEAASVRGYDASHTGLLEDPAVVRHVMALIAADTGRGGAVQSTAAAQTGWSSSIGPDRGDTVAVRLDPM